MASKTVLYSLRLGESNRMSFSIVQPEVRFGQNDVPQILVLIIINVQLLTNTIIIRSIILAWYILYSN